MLTLTLNETRVLGALFEKEHTTPDQYPLSLNALTLACNQKSNRDPVLKLDEGEVQWTVDALEKKGLVIEASMGSRVRRYKQRFGNTEFSDPKLSLKEQSLLCVLFLRGPQTPGELRSRTNRLCDFKDVSEVEQVLGALLDREGDALVARLAREPGKRESRYMHLFSGEVPEAAQATEPLQSPHEPAQKPVPSQAYESRIAYLEDQLLQMQDDIDRLKKHCGVIDTHV